jgi:hypothetical protein
MTTTPPTAVPPECTRLVEELLATAGEGVAEVIKQNPAQVTTLARQVRGKPREQVNEVLNTWLAAELLGPVLELIAEAARMGITRAQVDDHARELGRDTARALLTNPPTARA